MLLSLYLTPVFGCCHLSSISRYWPDWVRRVNVRLRNLFGGATCRTLSLLELGAAGLQLSGRADNPNLLLRHRPRPVIGPYDPAIPSGPPCQMRDSRSLAHLDTLGLPSFRPTAYLIVKVGHAGGHHFAVVIPVQLHLPSPASINSAPNCDYHGCPLSR